MLSNTEIYLIGLGFFLAILGTFLYFRKVSNSNKMLLKAKQANLKDFSYKSEAFAKQDLVILYLFSIDGNFFDMSQLNDFLINYGLSRIIIENFRVPDIQVGLKFNLLSQGQLLSIPIVILGFYFLYLCQYKQK